MQLLLLAIVPAHMEYYCREKLRHGTPRALLLGMIFQTNAAGQPDGDATDTGGHPTESVLRRHVSNDLRPRPRKLLVEHLDRCGECRAALRQLREARRRMVSP